MTLYHVSGKISSFGCEHGNIDIAEDGIAEIANEMIVAALISHGYTVTPHPEKTEAQQESDQESTTKDALPPVEDKPEVTQQETEAQQESAPALPLRGSAKPPAKQQKPATVSEEDALDAAVRTATGA